MEAKTQQKQSIFNFRLFQPLMTCYLFFIILHCQYDSGTDKEPCKIKSRHRNYKKKRPNSKITGQKYKIPNISWCTKKWKYANYLIYYMIQKIYLKDSYNFNLNYNNLTYIAVYRSRKCSMKG